MPATYPSAYPRAASALFAACVVALLLVLIATGLGVRIVVVPQTGLTSFVVTPEPVPPPTRPAERPAEASSGRAAPANARAVPKPVAAPPPMIRVPVVLAAPPLAGEGIAASAGAAEPGPGTGAGGEGGGPGSGGAGAGTGGGVAIRAHRIAGGINIRDYPRAARGATGTTILHLAVSAAGRVTGCDVAQSSGNAALDATTCRLAIKRFRYSPARNAAGRAVEDLAGWRQDWWDER